MKVLMKSNNIDFSVAHDIIQIHVDPNFMWSTRLILEHKVEDFVSPIRDSNFPSSHLDIFARENHNPVFVTAA
eukprot:CAMPEP_0114524794 /NCGR_PEP_ID=MMETSP0109-20121206/22057_1 /TAXON_ID=29199 /ORGANISM="Chlorarachnion reptans, Strain CCCM449" /LENGTH=72 /DNA_ID=CAMNT_0001706285 /DNA_START=694 /DNA_END=912 /DNA_ORIENTATION=-